MKAVERRGRALLGRCCLSLGGLIGVSALHAEVTFAPLITVGVSHTDNLTLAAENPEAETVYQLTPAFSVKQNSPRMNTDVNYRAEGYRYENRNDSAVYQIYNADFKAALDPDNFFLAFGASRDQTIRDPSSPIPLSNLAISGNRVDRDDYYVAPSFQYRVGSDATVRGSVRHVRTSYGEVDTAPLAVPTFDTNSTSFSVDNYRKERGLTWAASYTSDKTDYGPQFPNFEFRHAALELGTWVGNGSRFFASAGKESPWDDPLDPSLKDNFWEVGYAKRAGKNLNVSLAFGQRSFGKSKRASVDYAFERGQMLLSYSEQPATQGRNRTDYYLTNPTDLLTRPGVTERFIAKRFDWTYKVRLRRTEFSLNVYDETREQRTALDGSPLANEEQSGSEFLATWHLGVRTGLYARATTLHQDIGGANQDLTTTSIGTNRTLGPRTNASLDLSHVDSRNLTVHGYTTNLISLSLTRKL